MAFVMKQVLLARRSSRSRPMGRCAVSCEALECRQLLSAGVQPGDAAGVMWGFGSGGWESRWIDMAPVGNSTGVSAQVVSNIGNSGPMAIIEANPVGVPIQIMSAGNAGSTVTSLSPNALPENLNVGPVGGQSPVAIADNSGATPAVSTIGTFPESGGVSQGVCQFRS